MRFNSIEYAAFLPIVFGLYWSLRKSLRWQNVLLLVASYVFYGAWDYRFLSLLILSTVTDYFVGLRLAASEDQRTRRASLGVSLIVNLGILAFFKYFNFFIDSAQALLGDIGFVPNPPLLEIVLPLGLSFYTFQTMSYTFDIFRGRMKPTHSLLNFAVYVAFFPQLVAGPIERARRFLPQIESPRSVSRGDIRSGLALILLGLFKKVAIADVMAPIVNHVFARSSTAGTATLLVGVYAFSLQIYGDFSGYTDIARGSARLFGMDLIENFRQPYLSRNITEFWRTWHISLSNWLRDYLYIPLGGNRNGKLKTYRNIMITMLLGGLWHGAGWTFVVWGGLHGLYLALHRRFRGQATDEPGIWLLRDLGRTLVTFNLVSFTWIFFRAESLTQAVDYLTGILGRRGEGVLESQIALLLLAYLSIVTIDLLQRNTGRELFFLSWRPSARGFVYALLVVSLIVFSSGQQTPFIYFQF